MSLNTVLLRRTGRVGVPAPAPSAEVVSERAVQSVERQLLRLGFALHGEVRDALVSASPEDVSAWAEDLVSYAKAMVGAMVTHVALLPKSDTSPVVAKDVSKRLGGAGLPCTVCEETEAVAIVAPCLHFACESHRGAACAACGTSVEESALLPAVKPAGGLAAGLAVRSVRLSVDPVAAARSEAALLLSRVTPLSEADQVDLLEIVGLLPDLSWIPERIPVRESSALVAAHLLKTLPLEDVRSQVLGLWWSATDVLRTVNVLAGGDAGLTDLQEVPKLSRPMRRLVLEALDALSVEQALEGVFRHEVMWKRVAERLHPFEDAKRHPWAATVFAALRGTRVQGGLVDVVLPVVESRKDVLRLEGDRVVFSSWASRVEAALLSGEVREATRLLAQRPGDLIRRLNHLLTVMVRFEVDGLDGIAKVVREVGGSAGAGAVLGALGELSSRTQPSSERVFLPKSIVHVKSVPDVRIPLPGDVVDEVCRALSGVLVDRFSQVEDANRVVVIDESLRDVVVPTGERTASRSLVSIPRGSLLSIPDGQSLRLYLHWMQPEKVRVDLDLSVAMFDDAWNFVGVCDYTHLNFRNAARHSGDLTSAPAPMGASEFVDLDIAELLAQGVRRLAMMVYSFNDVAFENLPSAFAGVMLPSKRGQFDPRAVVQRFDLAGDSRSVIPMVVDLVDRKARWLDVPLGSQGGFHSVAGSLAPLTRTVRDLDSYYAAGRRLSVWEVAALHAAGTAEEVFIRRVDGRIVQVERAGMSRDVFAQRVLSVDGEVVESLPAGPRLDVALERSTVPVGSTSVALWGSAPEGVTSWGFSDLVALLG